jgi:hypothetical protein
MADCTGWVHASLAQPSMADARLHEFRQVLSVKVRIAGPMQPLSTDPHWQAHDDAWKLGAS